MNPIIKAARAFSRKAREKRASMFRDAFMLDENTKILDLGSETGSNIHAVLQGTLVKPENVYIADIDPGLIERGKDEFGFVPIWIGESKTLPFPDGYFDIVYCSSVIEHVTVPKEYVWSMYSGSEFVRESLKHQKEFADEIKRVGRQYFVQTPHKYFPIESHSWLPFVALLPRRILIPVLHLTNSFWVKKTSPDWHLLDKKEISNLFKDAKIITEKSFGLSKSIMAVRSVSGRG